MLKKFAIALIAAVFIALGVGLSLPNTWRVERTVLIDAPPERIYALLSDLKRWQEWSVWTRAMDPLLRNAYEGPQEGVGAKWIWLGPEMGRGRLVIVSSEPTKGIELDQAIESEVVNSHASLRFTIEDGKTRVTWIDEGTLPPLVGGFFRGTMEQKLGLHLASSLEKLKSILETRQEG